MSEHLDRMDREREVAQRVLRELAEPGATPPRAIANGAVINAWLLILNDGEAGRYDPAKCYLVTTRGIEEV